MAYGNEKTLEYTSVHKEQPQATNLNFLTTLQWLFLSIERGHSCCMDFLLWKDHMPIIKLMSGDT